MTTDSTNRTGDRWPNLPYDQWSDTLDTLHMWTQIVGKIRLSYSPPVNHFWHSALYVTPRGLTTSPIPFHGRTFEIVFDLIDHKLEIQTNDGQTRSMALYPRSVADFYRELVAVASSVDIPVQIFLKPQEVPDPIPFNEDEVHKSYDQTYVERFRHILVQVDTVFREFRGRFTGKCSPVTFWWGSFDLAVTRFSGRRAPPRPGADYIMREAYSHECSSAGFWPGNGGFGKPAFYSYTAPAPPGFELAAVRPQPAYYDRDLGEFVVLYDDIRGAENPYDALLDFCQSVYEAGADLGKWDRKNLERPLTTR